MSLFSNWAIYPLKEQAKNLLANGKVTICGTVRVDFRINQGPTGLFASFPAQKVPKDGKDQWYPHIHFPDEATKKVFQEEAVAQYNALAASGSTKPAKKAGKDLPF